jgi:transcription elongation factor Elf1
MSHLDRSYDDCPSCGSRQMINVALTLAGSPVSFTMCNVCEWKAWEREGERLPLGSVLTLVSAR